MSCESSFENAMQSMRFVQHACIVKNNLYNKLNYCIFIDLSKVLYKLYWKMYINTKKLCGLFCFYNGHL